MSLQFCVIQPIHRFELFQHPRHRCFLTSFRHSLITLTRSTFFHFCQIDSTDIIHHVPQIAIILCHNLAVQRLAMRIIRIIINPSLQVGKNILQIFHTIFAGFHRVITQVFLDSTRVITNLYLLATITINRVSRMFVHPLFHDRLFLPLVSRSGNILIIPFNQELVINTQIRGSQFHALIPGLRHVIEASVIHDTRCRPVFLSKRCRTQRINRESCRRGHVVHESQAMPYFVCHHVDQRGFHHVIR